MINERMRPLVRILSAYQQESYRELGKWVAHAVEATARGVRRGDTEEQVAGQLGHRLIHHNIEVTSLSVTADDRGAKFRRTGFTPAPVTRACVLQVTGQRDGLFATAARTVCFGPPSDEFRAAFDFAAKLAAIYRSYTEPGATVARVAEAANVLLVGTPFEFDGRLSQPGYGAGHFPAEELRRAGQDDPFAPGQALVWQPHVGAAASVDTVLVSAARPEPLTPPTEWPFKRITVRGVTSDIPDLLVRE
jgi:Xaa-Pro aminopeptidase